MASPDSLRRVLQGDGTGLVCRRCEASMPVGPTISLIRAQLIVRVLMYAAFIGVCLYHLPPLQHAEGPMRVVLGVMAGILVISGLVVLRGVLFEVRVLAALRRIQDTGREW